VKIEQIGDWTLEDRLATSGRPLIVMFVNSDGLKNHLLRAEFRRVAEEHRDAKFYEVDLLENPSLITKYSIPNPPMVLVFVDGLEVARHVGTLIATTVERVLGSRPPEEEDS
jgi:thiol-disulfide isomerase/thioredoxin